MKTTSIFCLICLFLACSVGKLVDTSDSVSRIDNQTFYFQNGKKAQLPINKGEKATVVYLVRHAEKAKEGGRDPVLTQEGMDRADRLQVILKDVGIDKVYSTEYQRTQLTAAPTAKISNQKVLSYNPRDLKGFAESLKKEQLGQEILVVGHSNTTPTLVNELLGMEKYPQIEESAYGHFFVVVLKENGTQEAFDLKF